jgi:glycine betaine/proline transport system permease protein
VTATLAAPSAPPEPAQPPIPVDRRRGPGRVWQVLIVLAVWIVLWKIFFGKSFIDTQSIDAVINWLQNVYDQVRAAQMTNPLFIDVLNPLASALNSLINSIQNEFEALGWTGVTALACALAFLGAGWRYALLTLVCFLSFGFLGLWTESMWTLDVVLLSVAISLVIGIPLGIWAGISRRFNAFITPILDVMQIMPSFAYLPIITLFFLIGPAAGTVATVIYAVPPAIRLTAAGVREVNKPTQEASLSLGATKWQLLTDVQLPLAKGTIVLGVNQTMMAALSMATIAALIDTPGLGQTVITAFETLNVGAAFAASIALIFMGIAFDRVTTAASVRAEASERSGHTSSRRTRLTRWGIALAIVAVGILLPAVFGSLAKFPIGWDISHLVIQWINDASNYAQLHWGAFLSWIDRVITERLINPTQSVLVNSPVIVTIAALAALSYILGRTRAALIASGCLVGVIILGVWQQSMVTLGSVLIGAALVMVVGVLFGIWMGRNRWVDRGLRPVLDAAQVMPVFVYLVPCLGLFGVGRFTGIIAALIYAAPVVIKIVAEGIRGVPVNSVEAAEAAGSNTWQMISKVQLPMSRNMVMVGLNQGMIFVLAMVVVSGLVGGGGLGEAVDAGFTQNSYQGLGLAAGFAIVLLGIMLDRVTQAAAGGERHRIDAL